MVENFPQTASQETLQTKEHFRFSGEYDGFAVF